MPERDDRATGRSSCTLKVSAEIDERLMEMIVVTTEKAAVTAMKTIAAELRGGSL